MVKKQPVVYKEIEYRYITACIMRLNNNDWVYELELLNNSKHAITIANIDDVKIKEVKNE